jgi:hypothetical protein
MRYPRLLRSVIRRHTDGEIVAAGRSAVAAKTINAGDNVPPGEQGGLITVYRLASLTALASATQSGQPRQTRLKPRQVDGLADVLHHKRHRHNMGLTIHYQLATTGDEAHARKLVQQLRQAALDLPFQHVGEIVEFRGEQCDYKQRADNDPHRWLLIPELLT